MRLNFARCVPEADHGIAAATHMDKGLSGRSTWVISVAAVHKSNSGSVSYCHDSRGSTSPTANSYDMP